ncbi:hypothetical protein [Paremcibacter congregatus]|uniref:hypothetical protein n=1 Tax=Paremcibacter congregatus TaxID=2043170 RepID=UPI0013FDAC37|nr:hypothetical protein [Paremcibacter congregatus]|tara:strand:+ start:407 stop:571 length:165 start_codon:yes stop_codon:yes gene_type:complete
MRLINGLIFGAGLGLITASASGLAQQYAIPVFMAGAIVILGDIALMLSQKKQRH